MGWSENVGTDDMQFRFMQGRGTTNAIFLVRQLQKVLGQNGEVI